MEESEDEYKSISKSQRKRDSHSLQDLGEELMALSVDQLKQFELPENLLEAILDSKRIKVSKHTAQKRQRQYVGRLMRDIDPAPIQEQLAAMKGLSDKHNAIMHLAEQWREKLLNETGSLNAFIADYPDAPAEHIIALLGKTREERATNKPPKHFRELYKLIHGQLKSKPVSDE